MFKSFCFKHHFIICTNSRANDHNENITDNIINGDILSFVGDDFNINLIVTLFVVLTQSCFLFFCFIKFILIELTTNIILNQCL